MKQYSLHIGDEAFIAPSAFFFTDLLQLIEGKKLVRFMGDNLGDPEDPHDHIYLAETSRKYTKVPFCRALTRCLHPCRVDLSCTAHYVPVPEQKHFRHPSDTCSFVDSLCRLEELYQKWLIRHRQQKTTSILSMTLSAMPPAAWSMPSHLV